MDSQAAPEQRALQVIVSICACVLGRPRDCEARRRNAAESRRTDFYHRKLAAGQFELSVAAQLWARRYWSSRSSQGRCSSNITYTNETPSYLN